jgi:3-methyl-2-oxobutanoate hydroxymethyltransferase
VKSVSLENSIIAKKGKKKIVMLTAYDCQVAKILDNVGIDLILVGDSLGMVFQCCPDTKSVTMADIVYHVKAVARGATNTPIIADMPINSYSTPDEALANARRFLEVGATGVKMEGYKPEPLRALVEAKIPVMGHVGMLPQSEEVYRLKGKKPEEAGQILRDAKNLDKSNVFSIVLECIPEALAKRITGEVRVPTIGIGAGKHCDGQVLVINDMLGLDETFKPKYVKTYANLNRSIRDAVSRFMQEVASEEYPDAEHTYH